MRKIGLSGIAAIVVAVAVIAGAALYWWKTRTVPPPPAPTPAPVTAAEPPPAPAPASSGPQYPLDAAPPAETASMPSGPLPALAASDAYVRQALIAFLGRDAVASFLGLDNFAQHVAATVDNLPRATAPARLWPVNPMAGRFTTESKGEQTVIAARNAERYAAFVRFVTSLDSAQVVTLYRGLYPLFQQAYQELGYPQAYFNDRVVEAIDDLLATPEPASPPAVVLPEIKGPVQPARPWVLYEFSDPALAERSSGQKTLLRMGVANTRAVKAKLREFRKLVAHGAPSPEAGASAGTR